MVQEALGEYIHRLKGTALPTVRRHQSGAIGAIAQDCLCCGTQRQRTASVKAVVGIWELIKPALVSALAEPIL